MNRLLSGCVAGCLLVLSALTAEAQLWNPGSAGVQAGEAATNLITWTAAGNLATNAGAVRWYAPGAITLVDARASVGTAPTGTNIACRVKLNGSITAGTATIAAAANLGSAVTLTNTLTATDYLTIDVTQVGSTLSGSDLAVRVRYK